MCSCSLFRFFDWYSFLVCDSGWMRDDGSGGKGDSNAGVDVETPLSVIFMTIICFRSDDNDATRRPMQREYIV